MRRCRRIAAVAAVVAAWAAPAAAWHGKGHHLATELSVAAADGLPAFFRAGAATVAHCSLDPDLFTRPIAPAVLHQGEAPEHYFDLELVEGMKLPPSRYEFLALCASKGLSGAKVGLLPYAVTEWTQRLTVALAEHRAGPDNPHVRLKCLVYAGILSHYAQDLCQPLHLTIHWDGRARSDGASPRTGIHTKVDALLGKLKVDPKRVLADVNPAAPIADLFPAVMAEIRKGHALVETVYRLADDLPALADPLKPGSPAAGFAAERLRGCVRFTASLYATAWKDSAGVKLPSWYERDDGAPKAAAAAGGRPKRADR